MFGKHLLSSLNEADILPTFWRHLADSFTMLARINFSWEIPSKSSKYSDLQDMFGSSSSSPISVFNELSIQPDVSFGIHFSAKKGKQCVKHGLHLRTLLNANNIINQPCFIILDFKIAVHVNCASRAHMSILNGSKKLDSNMFNQVKMKIGNNKHKIISIGMHLHYFLNFSKTMKELVPNFIYKFLVGRRINSKIQYW